MAKHTPGPWAWETYDTYEGESLAYADCLTSMSGPVGCDHTDGVPFAPRTGELLMFADEEESSGPCIRVSPGDARLIAAAPDLLEALREVMAEFVGSAMRRTAKGGAVADKARAAIAKAEGK